ncbi:hypothetical protein AVEN_42335-1 [Araneus ventricosus]|uniref:Uncharacterized protein n=1 Tax=Araneus ventricosus TaxID=182803 RepID=A0A4Y2GS03_ARAVE|nr:hypothetical protein AVEN_42335-1 [Araneus ventricosus]
MQILSGSSLPLRILSKYLLYKRRGIKNYWRKHPAEWLACAPANPMQSLARVRAPVLRSQGLSPAPREGAKRELVEAKGLRSICIKRPSSRKIGKVDEDNLYRMNSTGEEKRDVGMSFTFIGHRRKIGVCLYVDREIESDDALHSLRAQGRIKSFI